MGLKQASYTSKKCELSRQLALPVTVRELELGSGFGR